MKPLLIISTIILIGILYITNDDSLSKFQGKEIIDARTTKEVTEFAYKGKELPVKITENEVPELRTDSSYSELVSFNDDGTVTLRTKTYSGVSFFKENDIWHEVEYGTVAKNDFKLDVPLTRLLSGKVYATTIYSGAGDGTVYSNGIGTWSGSHDATTGTFVDSTGSDIVANTNFSAGTYYTSRGFIPFNTSSIPSSASISSATFHGYVDLKQNAVNDGNDWVNIVQTSQASETTLATADFDQAGSIDNPTEGATRIDIGSITTSAYNTWTLDSTGRGWIKKSGETANCGASNGWTCLGIREGHDALDSTPTGVNNIIILSSETSGTSQDPYLDITYTVPSSAFGSLFIGDKKLEIGNAKLEIGS